MKAGRPSHHSEVAAPAADRRERERLKKRRQRARRYDQGLKADGTPVTNPELSKACRVHWHPQDCTCYDCLFGREEDR